MNSKLVNIMGLIVSVLVFIFLISSFAKSLKRIKIGDSVIEKTKLKITKAEEENNRLEDQLKIMKSDLFIEKQYRDKMGLVKAGEIVLVLPEPEIVKKLAPQMPVEEENIPKSNFQKWLSLFK